MTIMIKMIAFMQCNVMYGPKIRWCLYVQWAPQSCGLHKTI